MSNGTDLHPGEELLIEHALHGSHPELQSHLCGCEACSRFIAEMQLVKRGISLVEDEDVPLRLQERILSMTRQKSPMYLIGNLLQTWHKSPFFIGIGTILLALLLYLLYMLAVV